MIFAASFEGSSSIRTEGPTFLLAFRNRVQAGLLSGRSHSRSNYVVTRTEGSSLHVRASDWWTAIAVGLNDIDLEVGEPGRVRYHVRYWRWAAYAVGFSAVLGLTLAVVFIAIDLPAYVQRHPDAMAAGFSVEQHVVFAWAMVVFWGFVWPWLLIALHKRAARSLLDRLIAEVDGQHTA